MIDPQLLRKDVALVAQKLATRRFQLDVDLYTQLEARRKVLQASAEDLQAKRNQFAKQIGMKKAKGEDASVEMSQSQECNESLSLATAQLDLLQKEIADFLMNIPNLPHESVPVGSDETGNVEILKWGDPPQFDFPIKDHVDLGAMHGLDFESAAKITGSRFVVLKGSLAKLHRALAQYPSWSMPRVCEGLVSCLNLKKIYLKCLEKCPTRILPIKKVRTQKIFI